MATRRDSAFTLVVPLDASDVADFKPDRPLKVALVGSEEKTLQSQLVELDARGQGSAKFVFEGEPPAELRVLVGPDDASDDEIVGLQTLAASLSRRQFLEPVLQLPPLRITDFYWGWWRRWCRTYTIRGRVVCADGSPVPGATVCAHDVDGIWSWLSTQTVGCATTDASGSFSMTFRWCCGWLPWWWWRLRDWRLDPDMWDRIRHLIELEPKLPIPPRPTVKPSLEVFEKLLGGAPLPGPKLDTGEMRRRLELATKMGAPRAAGTLDGSVNALSIEKLQLPRAEFDATALPALRERLVKLLPPAPELEALRIWPWFPREPWFDCAPDIAFRVTQNCDGQERVIVNEPWWRARWDIDTLTDVTLVATGDACCVRTPPVVEGNCMVLSSVCGVSVDRIGGNLGALPGPVGYAWPEAPESVYTDSPWAGLVRLEGQFGSAANVDYYEFEIWNPATSVWDKLVPGSAGGFSRRYFEGATLSFANAAFPFQILDGRYVVESRAHYETTHPGPWGVTRLWTGDDFDTLMNWYTANHYDNGEVHLRLKAYNRVGDTLTDERVVPLCGTENADPPVPNHLVLHLDNRTTGTPTEPSGDEPRAKVLDVRIAGDSAGPCSVTTVPAGASLEVDFVAYDMDAHLSQYTLVATFGADEPAIDLLATPGATLTGLPLGGAPAAVQVGPTYPLAIGQGAARPHWAGGGLRLHIPNLRDAIKRSCCYQIELWVYKRDIVNCDGSLPYRDFSFYSLTIAV